MTEGEPIGDPETLVRLASEAGLDAEAVRSALGGDAYQAEVRADESEARRLGIHGVPFFLFDGRFAVSGAQPADLMLRALTLAWDEVSNASASATPEGAACDETGCALPAES